ncbi:CFI-box-CTERM domain-containing protein [Telluria sp. Tellsp104]
MFLKEAAQVTIGPNIDNLLGMARNASQAGNVEEAQSYYNRVLELDPTVSEAWLGKGKAAGWQSSLAHMRFTEMLLAFNHAVANAPADTKSAVIAQCVQEANVLIVTLYGMARKNLLEFVALANTWTTYIAQVAQMLDALEAVHEWNRQHRDTLENIVHLCKDNIEGITYRDPYQNNVSKGWKLSPEYEAKMRSRLNAATTKLRLIDPGYMAPEVEVKKPDACFVVTATMGDADHPTVKFMRLFRDEWIMQKRWGNHFVDTYYKYGPIAARFISRSSLRRKISFVAIVTPAEWVARRLIRKRS